jgi:hypothetical protein
MGSGEMVARIVKQVGNRTVDGNKTLTLSARLEPLHGPLATSNGKVGILGAVVQALVRPMLDARHDFFLCRGI